MIRLRKGTSPQILIANAKAWTRELLASVRRFGKPDQQIQGRYRHEEIKQAVTRDSHGKCIYCESKLRHVCFGDIEHLRPKSRYHEDTFAWRNLGLVCQVCNNSKRDRFDEAAPPVNPFEEDPNEFFVAFGECVFARPGSERGLAMIHLVNLNRADLIEVRRERIRQIHRILCQLAVTKSAVARSVLEDELKTNLRAEQEFAMVARCAAKALAQPQHGAAIEYSVCPENEG